jgi:hypothetical protein
LLGVEYDFLRFFRLDLSPIGWNREAGIDLVLVGRHPTGLIPALEAVIAELRFATGLVLERGTSVLDKSVLTSAIRPLISIAFVASASVPDKLSLRSDVVVGSASCGLVQLTMDESQMHYVKAEIVFCWSEEIATERLGRLLRHFLGHALGLGHAMTNRQLMSADPAMEIATYAAGDLKGFDTLYKTVRRPKWGGSAKLCEL